MGILSWKVLGEPTMIRIAIVVCCAALAAAEGMFYNSYGPHGLYQPGYSTYRFPNAMRSYATPMTTSYHGYQAGFAAPATVGAHQPFGYAKREADAEPEAEADAFYNSFYNSFYNPSYNMAYSPYHYRNVYSGSYHQPTYNNFGYRSFYGKREAEAEAEAKAEPEAEAKPEAKAKADPAIFYNTGYNNGYNNGYNMAYNPYRYPTVYSGNQYQPSYNNFGYRSFYGKREAEAEPAMVYGQHGFYNPAYNTYTTGFPSFGSFYSGYRNFYQPSYYGGYGQ